MAQSLRPQEVALDASLWDEATTGIATYAKNLAAALEGLGYRVRKLGARQSGDYPRGAWPETAYTVLRAPMDFWRSGAPVFHAVGNFNLPLFRLPNRKMVLTVHDLIPLLFPETVSARYRLQFRSWLYRSLQVADAVICVSESTRRDVETHFRPRCRLFTIPEGADHALSATASQVDEVRVQSLGLPERYLLYAGSLDVRKNVSLLLDAMERLRRLGPVPPLVMLGQSWFGSTPVEQRIESLRASGMDIRPLGYQPEPVFFEVVRRATLFVFPSRYEGFGLPPLEAMALGVPAIVCKTSSLPEVCGDAAVYVEPDDAEGLAGALSGLWRSPEERQQRSERGRQWARRFTWRACAEATAKVYQSL
jgi:glycosyltransferase involved in cell wall biosynthesis